MVYSRLSKDEIKGWYLFLTALTFFIFGFFFTKQWLLVIGAILIVFAVVYQKRHKKKIGVLNGIIIAICLIFTAAWLIGPIFPTRGGVYRYYSFHYEDRSNIRALTGIDIPRYQIVDSKLVHFHTFDFEFEVQADIKFKKPLDENLFLFLDSICALHVPSEIDKTSSYFYYGLEDKYPCWTKDGDVYKYVRITDFGEEFLHSTDAYFYFILTRGSETASLVYGNY